MHLADADGLVDGDVDRPRVAAAARADLAVSQVGDVPPAVGARLNDGLRHVPIVRLDSVWSPSLLDLSRPVNRGGEPYAAGERQQGSGRHPCWSRARHM